MTQFRLSALSTSALILASCGNSDNKSAQTCAQPTPPQLKSIRAPISSTTPSTPPTQPTDGQAPQNNTGKECTPAPAGNLNSPTLPGTNPQAPNMSGSNFNGRWSLVSEMCENGVLSDRMKSTSDMLRSGQFSYQLTINNSTVNEAVYVSISIENAGNMMCSMTRTSTLEKAGNQLRITSPASSFTDAGGDVPCNLGAASAETISVRQMQVQGPSLIIELPKAEECGGLSKIQVYSGMTL
ncbi:MAG: hypothetical protein RJB13_1639 [Pseudomonadota bacterium]